jgi:hypothetical protein
MNRGWTRMNVDGKLLNEKLDHYGKPVIRRKFEV